MLTAFAKGTEMGRTTRFGVFCLLASVTALVLASSRGVTGIWLGLPLVLAGLVLAVGLVLDHRRRRAGPDGPSANWAEDLTARVRTERAQARGAGSAAPTGSAARPVG